MESHPTTPLPEPGTLRLDLEIDDLAGDRLAALIESVRHVCGDQVTLADFQCSPVRLSFVGTMSSLERLRVAIADDTLRPVLGACRPATQLSTGEWGRATTRDRRLVLLVFGDPARGRQFAATLGRAEIQTCVVSRSAAALHLLQRTALPFDAVVLQHRLADLDGVELLRRVHVNHRPAVLVFDERPDPNVALTYRGLGAHRYLPTPSQSMELIGKVNATIAETLAWRSVEQPSVPQDGEPPPQYIDPELAADRLAHVCRLTSVEREVALMVLLGRRDLDIADCLGKSERTAKRHVGRVLEKAGVKNRASLWAVLYLDGRSGEPSSSVLRPEISAPTATPAPGVPRGSVPHTSPVPPSGAW